MIKIAGICGSLKPNSANHRLLHAAWKQGAPESELNLIDWSMIKIFDDQSAPSSDLLEIAAQISISDALLISSPEYNWSIPGGLKNLLDWLSVLPQNPILNKPTLIMGASSGRLGTARMQPHLRSVLTHFKADLVSHPEVAISNTSEVFDPSGDLIAPEIENLLKQAMAELIKLVPAS